MANTRLDDVDLSWRYTGQYPQHYTTSTIRPSLNKFVFLYSTLFLPLLHRICSYLDKFTIRHYKKGPHKNDRYITLPREDLTPFNKLLDDAAICFLHISRLTSCRSHAAQYVADKQKLLGNDDDFA